MIYWTLSPHSISENNDDRKTHKYDVPSGGNWKDHHNRILFFPSGVISFRFTDEFDDQFDKLVRAVENVRSASQ